MKYISWRCDYCDHELARREYDAFGVDDADPDSPAHVCAACSRSMDEHIKEQRRPADPRDLTAAEASACLNSDDPARHDVLRAHLDALRDDLRAEKGLQVASTAETLGGGDPSLQSVVATAYEQAQRGEGVAAYFSDADDLLPDRKLICEQHDTWSIFRADKCKACELIKSG